MARVLFIEGRKDGYSPEQCSDTMTVGELISYLQNNCYENDLVMLKNDNGYTYGTVTASSFKDGAIKDKSIFEPYLDIVLEDDDTETGGTEWYNQTLGEFLFELDDSDMPQTFEELNAILVECGIMPIEFK